MREDSFVSSSGPDQFSETAVFSGSDSETQGPATPSQDFADHRADSALSDSEPPPPPPASSSVQQQSDVNHAPSEARHSPSDELRSSADVLPTATDPVESVQEVNTEKEVEEEKKSVPEPPAHPAPRRSSSVLSRNLSTDSTCVSRLTLVSCSLRLAYEQFKDPDIHSSFHVL